MWAISTPRERECSAETLAQKAIGAGVEGVQVDGNDVIAVYSVARRAIEKARGGGGPSLIEALSYRLGDHTTADDATRYRDPEELRRAWAREPIGRLRTYLAANGLWTKEQEDALLKQCAAEVEQAVAAYLATPPRQSDFMFDHLYASPPFALRSQIVEARRFGPGHKSTPGTEDG